MSLSSPELSLKQRGVLSHLPLRVRLAAAFVTSLVAVLTLVSMTYVAVNFSSKQSNELQIAGAKLDFVNDLTLASTALQLAATRYVYLGHDSAREYVTNNIDLWLNEIAACRERSCLNQERIDDVDTHLNAFLDAFNLVATSRSDIANALISDFANLRVSAPTTNNTVDYPGAGQINSINDHISTIEATLLAYFVTSDSQRISDAEAHLDELKGHLASTFGALEETQNTAVGSFSIDRLENSLYANIQRIRSYAYLVNVVLPSEAREMEYLASNVAAEVHEEIAALQTSMQSNRQNFYVWVFSLTAFVLLLSIPMFFWLLNSVTSPLKNLSAVFHRLTQGSEEKIIGAELTKDEIGDLFKAAEAFRRENVRERELLADYRELSRNLESQVTERTRELEAKNAELDHIASVDKLTDTYNRRALDAALSAELERANRYQRPLSVLLMDIDFFKHVNDQYGHLTGDKVLVTLCQKIKENLRASDILGRWGGEEFLVICPETDLEQARNAAEKVRRAIEKTDFELSKNITISVGISVLMENATVESLVAEADKALYLAKSQGRNRVCIAPMMLAPLHAAPPQ
ncbi:diguanylate cyclase [Congregibacter variabilis]|uniref:diguanylate cyclase n=1 Tax=Congregibacter variabilis TaxID=3081200 RepID=A0ABZ0I6G4_9GAMM|nr:diguanylate cyclase [Congregibacter sp. IMCC43200]